MLDCFFAVPSEAAGEMDEIEIDFADASTQIFHVGESSVAVPGLLLGLVEAHERRGLLAWERLFTPALELARRPLEATPEQAFLHEILVPILQREEGGRRIYGVAGLIDTADLVPTLLLLRDARADAVPLLLTQLADDLAAYRVEERTPLEGTFAGTTVRTTPPPSLGGAVVQTGLAELDGSQREPAGSPAEARALTRALAAAYGGAGAGARPTGTTHVSVVDSDGAAVGLSSTLGSGSGVFRHGFQLNNMLGERDVIGLEPREPGTRLPSMMTPTLVLDEEGGPRLVAGSAGSVRLAGAILQVVAGVVGQGLPVDEAIARPRLHVAGDTLHVEGGWPDAVAAGLAEERSRRARLGRSQPLLRRRLGRRAATERPAGRCRRSQARRPRRRRSMIEIRPADPADASQLIVLAAEVGREPGDFLLTTDTLAGRGRRAPLPEGGAPASRRRRPRRDRRARARRSPLARTRPASVERPRRRPRPHGRRKPSASGCWPGAPRRGGRVGASCGCAQAGAPRLSVERAGDSPL